VLILKEDATLALLDACGLRISRGDFPKEKHHAATSNRKVNLRQKLLTFIILSDQSKNSASVTLVWQVTSIPSPSWFSYT
jgi:hypothetical protein